MKRNGKKEADVYLGEIFRDQRKKLSLTQDDVAEYFNTTRVSICRYENGDRSMTASMFFDLCDYLQLDCNVVADEVTRRMNEK